MPRERHLRSESVKRPMAIDPGDSDICFSAYSAGGVLLNPAGWRPLGCRLLPKWIRCPRRDPRSSGCASAAVRRSAQRQRMYSCFTVFERMRCVRRFVVFVHDGWMLCCKGSEARTRRRGLRRVELVCRPRRRIRFAAALHDECPARTASVDARRPASTARLQPGATGRRHGIGGICHRRQ
jgi:hypothetical protein